MIIMRGIHTFDRDDWKYFATVKPFAKGVDPKSFILQYDNFTVFCAADKYGVTVKVYTHKAGVITVYKKRIKADMEGILQEFSQVYQGMFLSNEQELVNDIVSMGFSKRRGA